MNGSAQSRRHDGQLGNHAVLPRHARFHTSDITAGQAFEANLAALNNAVNGWLACCKAFTDAAEKYQMTAAVRDGSGPVARVLGPRFNHRLGHGGGVMWAVDAYQKRLLQLLDGLNRTAQNLEQAEATAVAGFQEAAS